MGGMGGGMGGAPAAAPASKKEAASQKADQGVGFDGGGIGVDEPPTPARRKSPSRSRRPHRPRSCLSSAAREMPRSARPAQNLGQGTVNGVWAYQGSKPLFYRGRLYASMGDTLVCVDPKTERVLWKKQLLGAEGEGREEGAEGLPRTRNSSTPPSARRHSPTAKCSLARATATWSASRPTRASCSGRQTWARRNPSVFSRRSPAVASTSPRSPAAYTPGDRRPKGRRLVDVGRQCGPQRHDAGREPQTLGPAQIGVSPFAPRKDATFAERKATLIDSPVLSNVGNNLPRFESWMPPVVRGSRATTWRWASTCLATSVRIPRASRWH